MGYSLTIGELKKYKETEDDEVYEYYRAETVTNMDSPGGNVPTAHTNQRWPSYSGWSFFCKDTGLDAIMKELMPDHPGYGVLNKSHLNAFKAVDKTKIDPYNVERLEWLIWWTDWALNNCKVPVFHNY